MPDNQNSSEWALNPEPKFGEWLRGTYASETNPQRDGMYVRTIRRAGRMNPGTFYELTDGNGRMWCYPAQSVERVAAPAPAMLNGVEGLVAQWRHNAQGCGRRDQHAAGTWRSCARELDAALRAADNRDAAGVEDESCPHEAWDENGGWCKCNDCGFGWSASKNAPTPNEGGEVVAEFIKSALGNYPVLKWRDGYIARIGDKFYTTPPAAPAAAPAGEAVAEVCAGWTLCFVGSAPIAEICRQHPELRIGTKLYTHPPAAEVREVDAVLLQEAEFVHDEYIRGFNDGVKATNSDFDAIGVVLERDSLKEQLYDEIAANLAFREAGGAMPDEDMPTFCGRLIAERNAVIPIIESWRHDADAADGIARLDRNALRACADELAAALSPPGRAEGGGNRHGDQGW